MRRAVFVLVAATTLLSACSGESTTSPTTNPPPALTVTAVTISGTAPAVGQTSQLTATATMSNGTTQDVTAQAAWQSSNTSVVIVSGSGVVTGVAAGEADVTVAFSGASGSLHVKLQARTFAVAGLISDSESGRSIDGEVEVLDGANAGRVTRADSTGHYSLSGLVAGSFAARARATGYDSSDIRVTIVDSDARLSPRAANRRSRPRGRMQQFRELLNKDVVRLPFYAPCQDIESRLGIDQLEAYSTSVLACKKVDHVVINRAR